MRTLPILLLAAMLAQAESLRVAWNRTPEVFAGKSVTVQLASGTQIRGAWTDVTSTTFTMKIYKSSNQAEVPEGIQVLQKSTVSRVGIPKPQKRGRVIGALVGFFGTGFTSAGIHHALNPGDPDIGSGLFAAAGGFAGWWVGHYFDDRATQEVLLVN